jgi:hypothetical protein
MPLVFTLFSGVFSHWSAKAVDIALTVVGVVVLGIWFLHMHDQARDNARALADAKIISDAKDAKQAAVVQGLQNLNSATLADMATIASIKAAAHALPPTTGCINSPGVQLLRNRLQRPDAADPGNAAAHP